MTDKNINESTKKSSKWFQDFNKLSEYQKLEEIIKIEDNDKLIEIFNNDNSNHIKLATFSKINDLKILEEVREKMISQEDNDLQLDLLYFLNMLEQESKYEFNYLELWISLNKWSKKLDKLLKNSRDLCLEIINQFFQYDSHIYNKSRDLVDKLIKCNYLLFIIGFVELPFRIIIIRLFDEPVAENLVNVELWFLNEISSLIEKSRPKLGKDEIYVQRALIERLSNSNLIESFKLKFFKIDFFKIGYNCLMGIYRSNFFKLNEDFIYNLLNGPRSSLIAGLTKEKLNDIDEESKEQPLIHGIRFYPPHWISPLPEITTEFLLKNDRLNFKNIPESFFYQLDNVELKYYYDGFLLCSNENLDEAYILFKIISITAFINGFLVYSIKKSDILKGRRRTRALRITSSGFEWIELDKLDYEAIDPKRNEFYKDFSKAIQISRSEIKEIFEMALWLKTLPELRILFDFLQRAYMFYCEEDYSSCLLNAWIIIEQTIEYIWDSVLLEKRVSSNMKKRMKKFPQWTTDSYLDSLILLGELKPEKADKIRDIKSRRNDIVHRGLSTTKGYARISLNISLDILIENCNRRGITRINFTRLYNEFIEFLDK